MCGMWAVQDANNTPLTKKIAVTATEGDRRILVSRRDPTAAVATSDKPAPAQRNGSSLRNLPARPAQYEP